jgi:hypothetical protein
MSPPRIEPPGGKPGRRHLRQERSRLIAPKSSRRKPSLPAANPHLWPEACKCSIKSIRGRGVERGECGSIRDPRPRHG